MEGGGHWLLVLLLLLLLLFVIVVVGGIVLAGLEVDLVLKGSDYSLQLVGDLVSKEGHLNLYLVQPGFAVFKDVANTIYAGAVRFVTTLHVVHNFIVRLSSLIGLGEEIVGDVE